MNILRQRRFLVLCSLVFMLMIIHTLNQQWSQDFWAHAAAVRELATHPFDPLHPQLDLDAPHPFFTAYALAAAALSKVPGADHVSALAGLAFLNLTLVLVGLWAFSKTTLRTSQAAFYVLIFTLILWGIRPWRYSGFLHLNALGFELPLPSTFATGMALLALAGFASFIRSGSVFRLLEVAVASALVLVSHPLTAIFLGVGTMALAQAAPPGGRRQALLGAMVLGTISLLAALVWPYFSFIDLVFGEGARFDLSNRVMYDGALLRIWPALLGLPLLIARWQINRRDPLVWTFVGLAGIYVLGGLARAWSYGRVMPALVLVLHMALADWLAGLEERGRVHTAGFLGIGGLLAIGSIGVLPGLVRAVPEPLLPMSIRTDPRLETTAERYRFLADEMNQYDTVLADLANAWPVPAYGGKVVANMVPQLFVDNHPQRQRDVLRFFDANTTSTERLAIIDLYDVEYLLVDRTDIAPAAMVEIEVLGSVASTDGDLILIEVGVSGDPQTQDARRSAGG